MMSDYRWLVWEMKNVLVNSSHTALFVSVGTKPNSKPLTWNATHFLCFFLSDQYCAVREYFETSGTIGGSLVGKGCVFSPGLRGYPLGIRFPPQSHMLTGDCKCPQALRG